MFLRICRTFLPLVILAGCLSTGWANSRHHDLNGTWRLLPIRSEYAGERAIQTGTVIINDRERNISITRNFTYDGTNRSTSYNFSTDGPENTLISEGSDLKSKAKWEGDVLKVTSTTGDVATIERYQLDIHGSLMLTVERTGHPTERLFFDRLYDAPATSGS